MHSLISSLRVSVLFSNTLFNLQKETSEAVNSIMDDPKSTRSHEDTEMSVEDKMDVLENLRGRKQSSTLVFLALT